MRKADIEECLSEILIWLDHNQPDPNAYLSVEIIMNLVDKLINVTSVCQTEIMKRKVKE